ncbi:MAG: hypothetical protein KF690_00255 [Bacteroidetes bacterium]|nr:hypothetical protein [Bacteroidota bacterium]
MKTPRTLLWLTAVALLLSGILLMQVWRLREEVRQAPAQAKAPAADFELAVHMTRLQQHMEKLYWAIDAHNGPLARFYAHELEETAEAILAANVIDEGVDISGNLRLHLTPVLHSLADSLKSPHWQAMPATYLRVVQSCNNCHVASKHDFIRIQVPARPSWSNQDFRLP